MDADAIVIGSGAGGLTAALALGRLGKRVAVFEQHTLPGGWCHSFALGGYTFSPGVHYIGGLDEGGPMRNLYEGLGLGTALTFMELNPDGYDHIQVGQERFDIPRGKAAYADRLCTRFPSEARGIHHYLNTVERISHELETGLRASRLRDAASLPWRLRTVLRHGLRPLGDFLDRFTRDPLLRAILSAQAGDHGMGPAQAPTAIHAAVATHYFNGGYYPKGGARALPMAFLHAIRAHGGVVKVNTPVAQILVEGDRAIGVRLGDGTEVRADIVISNADPHATYAKLLPEDAVPARIQRKLKRTQYSVSALSLFLAAKIDARGAGLDSGNQWYLQDTDVDAVYADARRPDLDAITAYKGGFLTVTSLKDPSKQKNGVHTMEAFTFVSNDAFARWAHTAHDARPADYEAFKERLSNRMFDMVEKIVPGLRDKTVFHALGTPLTNQFYTAGTQGNLYGTDKSRGQIGPFAFPIRSGLKGLYHCGASTLGHGVSGASFSGMAAALAATGARRRDVLTGTGSLTILQAEDPTLWPDATRRDGTFERQPASVPRNTVAGA